MKYFENSKTIIKNNTSGKILYVCQDVGNDGNNGSLTSPFKTIQAAITVAETTAAYYNQVIIKVNPSSTGNGYNENLTFSQQGVNLESAVTTYRSDAIVIKGTVTVNLTGTSGGTNFVAASNIIYIKGFVISTNSGNTLTFSGTTFQRLFLSDTYIDNTGSGSGLVMTNTGTSGATKSTLTCHNSDINNSSNSNPTILISAGRLNISGTQYDIQNSNASGKSLVMDGASAASATANIAEAGMTGQISITDNTANLSLSLCTVASGSLACIVTPSSVNTGVISLGNVGFTTTATNTITGSGVVAVLGAYKLSTGGDIIGTVTQATVGTFPQGPILLGTGASQTTNALLTIKNGHLKVQQTTAPTIAATANAGTGAAVALTNATDIAGNISLTTGSLASTVAGIQCTITFNKAYNVAPIVVITATNGNAILNSVTAGIFVTCTTTTFSINFANAGTAATNFTWKYICMETQ